MFQLFQLVWIVLVDAALSLDNAVLICGVAKNVPEAERDRVKVFGVLGAVVARIAFAFLGAWLLRYAAFTLIGGGYLLFVAWNMWRKHGESEKTDKKWWEHMFGPIPQIIVADVMMSGDNVLAIAHTARGNVWLMTFGIVLSIALMFFAMRWIAVALERFKWAFPAACGIVAATGAHMVWIGIFTRV